MILVSDPVFGEVELTGSVKELARLAGAVAEGEGFISSVAATAPDRESLAGGEVRQAPGPGVLIHLDSPRRILVISGDPVARALFADNLDAMTTAMAAVDGGGHRHIDHFARHPYLVEGSMPLVVGIPGGGPPTR
ncbi:Imm32 family immunity protein [Streptomyces violascens]|uniref:Imm32 family immunity protein n=1 Tax=Streptomyces violascens TaxID=67381 RepID=UPI0036768ED1